MTINLATKLWNKGVNCNFELVWNRGHDDDYEINDMFAWLNSLER